MLDIRKNTFSKNYENSFFREFSRHLYNSFKNQNISGVLIGSPLCEVDERLQIDALLITPNVVCIIDFKNYKGKVKLPFEKNFEFGLWTTEEGDQIKGGSSINPFIQLKNQKRRFIEVSNKFIEKHLASTDIFNPLHLVRVVCFQEDVELIGKIPSHEALNFFILNKINFLEGILDIVDVSDKEVNLSENSFDAFKRIFRADQFKFDNKPYEDKLKEVAGRSTKLDFTTLHEDQKAALIEIKFFLENQEEQVFILQGTMNSGKSFLIPFIQELAYNTAIPETEIFGATGRIAKNLLSSGGLEKVNSIYSFIYGGRRIEVEKIDEIKEEITEDKEDQEFPDEISLETVPLKKCDNSHNALFIVDESQLVSDSYHQSIDLIFGSGYLLQDFLKFTDIISSKRKLIFIGDPYQLQLGKTDETPLNPSYLEETYKLKVACFQLLDKEEFSEINKQSLSCVKNIKSHIYNSLRFKSGEHFTFLSKKGDIFTHIANNISHNSDCHILTFTNEESQKVNCWIKKTIIKNGEDLAPKDLVLFNNTISVEDESDPFAGPKKIYNGQFATVEFVANTAYLEESRKIKGELTKITFRELTIQLNETGQQVKVLSLENYRLNPKAELSKSELILYTTLINEELSIARKQFNKSREYSMLLDDSSFIKYGGENDDFISQLIKGSSRKKDLNEEQLQLKNLINRAKQSYRNRIESNLRKDPSTKFYKLKNAAQLRFAWAMTVHKSMSYKWKEIIFNVDPGENAGRTNENYFRWLYTGISRARKTVSLINYNPISPFDNTEFKDQNSGIRPIDILFHSDNPDISARLEDLKEFVSAKVIKKHFTIRNVQHYNWQERYLLTDENNQEALISFTYNGHGHFKMPSVIGGNLKAATDVIELLNVKNRLTSFYGIKDIWRQVEYDQLKNALTLLGIYFELILQTNYKDKIRLFSTMDELDIEVDYGSDGMVNFITAKFYSDSSIWEHFKKTIEAIRK